MDIDKYNKIKPLKHWAQELKNGDKCNVIIRHKTDGTKNIIADVTAVENKLDDNLLVVSYRNRLRVIPYNDIIK